MSLTQIPDWFSHVYHLLPGQKSKLLSPMLRLLSLRGQRRILSDAPVSS